ncbi:MAG: arylesterase [Verrucomicrobiae bacterium]|nr:arylesterase [Verrucomicrobiae bacterium]
MPLPMFSRLIATFVFMFFFAAATQAGTILVWGDSLSAGYGLEKGQEWPALLQTRLADKGFSHAVVNASVSGETSSGGRSRLPAALEAHAPDVVVLELGANDGLRGLKPVESSEENLTAILNRVKQKYPEAKLVLAGMQVPPNMGPDYSDAFRKVFPEVAQKTGAHLIPFILEGVGGVERLNQSDGIHPTVEGHRIIADLVWSHLEPLLEK